MDGLACVWETCVDGRIKAEVYPGALKIDDNNRGRGEQIGLIGRFLEEYPARLKYRRRLAQQTARHR